jgi:mRNA interferase HigB
VRIIARSKLRSFWEKHSDSEQPLKAWFAEAKRASWKSPNEDKLHYSSASILQKQRVVFNISGNKYRLILMVTYGIQMAYIRFIGTHEEYDGINAEEI